MSRARRLQRHRTGALRHGASLVAAYDDNAETAACEADVKTVNVASDAYNAATGAFPVQVGMLSRFVRAIETFVGRGHRSDETDHFPSLAIAGAA